MTTGLHGKVMAYDGENRPLSVTHNGKTTSYVYAADGTRLKKITDDGDPNEAVTAYINGAEFRNFGQGTAEEILTHLAGEVRLTAKTSGTRTDVLQHDQLGSVIGISNSAGTVAERRAYHPFGKTSWEHTYDLTLTDETKGFIGERYDEDAGLQYLNARYYDPELALFIQPDWFPVTEQGVGTNRYAYANNDPINKLDPNGNSFLTQIFGLILGIVTGNPVVAGAFMTGFETAVAIHHGASLGDTLKSAAIQFAIQTAVYGLQESGIFGGDGAGAAGEGPKETFSSRGKTTGSTGQGALKGTKETASNGRLGNQRGAQPTQNRRMQVGPEKTGHNSHGAARRILQKAQVKFGDLKRHYLDHAADLGIDSISGYAESAVNHIKTGTKFKVRHGLKTKYHYISRFQGKGGGYVLTSTSRSGRRIFTHYVEQRARGLRNLGIELPNGF